MARLIHKNHLRRSKFARLRKGKRTKAFLAGEAARLDATATGVTMTGTNATDTLNVAAHGLHTGDPFRVANSGGALPAGLAAATDYYAIVTGAGTLKAATTRANALAGTAIDITTDGTGTNTLLRRGTSQRVFEQMKRVPRMKARQIRATADIDTLT